MRRKLALLLLFVVLAVVLRMLVYWKDSPDSVYHLRRARFAVANFPRTIIVDPFMRFPEGGICIWPPLFDVSLALPAWLKDGPDAATKTIEDTAFVMPILFSAGAVIAAALAGSAIRTRTGLFAGLFVALSPAHLQYSQYGHTDQHVAETLWGFLALAFFLYSCRAKSVGKRAVYETLTGLCLAFAVLTWQGSIFWAALFAVPLMFESFSRRLSPQRAIRVLGIPAIVTAAGTWYWLAGRQAPFTYVSFGWFQPVFLAATLASVLAVVLATRSSLQNRRQLAFTILALISASVPALMYSGNFVRLVGSGVSHLTSSSAGSEIVSGGYLSYPKEWLEQIIEYRPLLADRWDWPVGFLSFSFFLTPLALCFWFRDAVRSFNRPLYIALFCWGAFVFGITLLQRRHLYYASLLGGVVAIELSSRIAVMLRRRMERKDRIRAASVLFPVVYAVFLLPMLLQLPKEIARPYEIRNDHREALLALKSMAASSVDAYDPRFLDSRFDPSSLEGGSVMAFWSQGHLITYFSELPVVANNFGYNFFESLHFFFAQTEEEAVSIARRHRVRFVLVMDLLPIMNQYGTVIGQPDFIVWSEGKWRVTEKYFRTLESRLYDFEGEGLQREGLVIEPLRHFRLRYRSKTGFERFGRFVAQWKIFEVI